MKTERRHELQTNQLADWLGHQVEHVKPHGKTILAAGILGAAVIIVATVLIQDREDSQASAWTDFHLLVGGQDSVALAELAKRNSGTMVGLWAREAQARMDLERGTAALFTNRDEAMLALSDSRKGFAEVIAAATSEPELLQLSLYGLGQAQEASGNLEAAREYYQQAIQKAPDSVVGKQAATRLELAKKSDVASFYNWFAKQKPRPSSPLSMPNIPGFPHDLSKLPDMPDLPAAPEGGPVTPATEITGPGDPATSTPQEKSPNPPSPTPPAPEADRPTKDAPPTNATPAPPIVPPTGTTPDATPSTTSPAPTPSAAPNPGTPNPPAPAPAALPPSQPTVPPNPTPSSPTDPGAPKS